jgi:hypothetical protein
LMPLLAGVLIGLATITATNGLLAAQASTPAADQPTMMEMGTPSATDAEMAAQMEKMMEQCMAMMKMMSAMMGGDMAGMMREEGIQGMEGMDEMPAATPGA